MAQWNYKRKREKDNGANEVWNTGEYRQSDVHNYGGHVTLIGGGSGTAVMNGGGGNSVGTSMGLGDIVRDGSFDDPTCHLFSNCEDLLDNEPLLISIHTKQAYALFGKGIMFQTDSGMPVIPDSDNELASAVDEYWIPFLYDSFRFLWIYGFLVVYIYETNSGARVFAVPESSKIVVDKVDDIKRGCTILRARWVSGRTQSPLYIFQNALPFAIRNKQYRKSPVECVKPWISELYAMLECRAVTFANIARSAIIVEKVQQKTPSGQTMQDDLPLTDPIDELYLAGDKERATADAFYSSVDQLKQVSLSDKLNSIKVPVKPWVRRMVLMNERPEARYAPIPPGSHGAAVATGAPDLDFLANVQYLEAKIRSFFGEKGESGGGMDVGGKAKSKGVNNGAEKTGGGQNDKSDAGTPDGNMLFMWREYYCKLLTQLFNILYATDNIEICDVKATYADEKEVLVEEDTEYKITELLHVIPENQKHISADPAATESEDGDAEDNNNSDIKGIGKSSTSKTKNAPSSPPPPQKEEVKEEKLKNSSRIRVMLVTRHVTSRHCEKACGSRGDVSGRIQPLASASGEVARGGRRDK